MSEAAINPPYGCVWKCCVPHCTQWFCWSLSLLNGYFIGDIPNIFRQTHIHHPSFTMTILTGIPTSPLDHSGCRHGAGELGGKLTAIFVRFCWVHPLQRKEIEKTWKITSWNSDGFSIFFKCGAIYIYILHTMLYPVCLVISALLYPPWGITVSACINLAWIRVIPLPNQLYIQIFYLPSCVACSQRWAMNQACGIREEIEVEKIGRWLYI